MRSFAIALASLLAVSTSVANGDIVLYRIPMLSPPLVVMLQGQAKTLTKKTVSYRHPTFRNATLMLATQDTKILVAIEKQKRKRISLLLERLLY